MNSKIRKCIVIPVGLFAALFVLSRFGVIKRSRESLKHVNDAIDGLVGKWELEASDNLDALLRSLGQCDSNCFVTSFARVTWQLMPMENVTIYMDQKLWTAKVLSGQHVDPQYPYMWCSTRSIIRRGRTIRVPFIIFTYGPAIQTSTILSFENVMKRLSVNQYCFSRYILPMIIFVFKFRSRFKLVRNDCVKRPI